MRYMYCVLVIPVFLFVGLKSNSMKDTHQKVIDEYPPEYCLQLEKAYGKGMMSEGGSEAIELMFMNISKQGKKALDIGSGLGGMALYLADTYNMNVIGIDINPWMIQEATRRIPEHLVSQLRYVCSISDKELNFPDAHFDIVYSKGALTHIEDKSSILKECRRVLKPNGILVITDWLSSVQGQWGRNISQMAASDGLTIFAQTLEGYIQDLKSAGFDTITVRDDSKICRRYNQDVCDWLFLETTKKEFIRLFGQEIYFDHLEGYKAIVKAFDEGELTEVCFIVS